MKFQRPFLNVVLPKRSQRIDRINVIPISKPVSPNLAVCVDIKVSQFPVGAKMFFKRQRIARVLGISAVLTLCSCASSTGPALFPDTWAPMESVKTADGCPRLDGTYSNLGIETLPKDLGAPPKLTEIFAQMGRGSGPVSPKSNGQIWPETADAAFVQIRQTPEALAVTFLGDRAEETTLNFRRYHFNWSEQRYDDLFTCYQGERGESLRFMAEPESHSAMFGNLYMEAAGTLVFLLKSTDGSLIVHWRSESFAASSFLLGSHMRYTSVWWRFPASSNSR